MGFTLSMGVIPEVKKIRDLFYKHMASGMMAHHAAHFAIVVGELSYIALVTFLFSFTFSFCVGRVERILMLWGFIALNADVCTSLCQLFSSLVKDVKTCMALNGAIIGIKLFGSGYIVKHRFKNSWFLMTFYNAPGHYAYEGTIMSQFEGIKTEVLAAEGSSYFYSRSCVDGQEDDCIGDMKSYTKFTFGNLFSPDHVERNDMILLGYLLFALIGTNFALKKLNHMNT